MVAVYMFVAARRPALLRQAAALGRALRPRHLCRDEPDRRAAALRRAPFRRARAADRRPSSSATSSWSACRSPGSRRAISADRSAFATRSLLFSVTRNNAKTDGRNMTAGYSGTPLAQKLSLKDGMRTWWEDMPDGVRAEIEARRPRPQPALGAGRPDRRRPYLRHRRAPTWRRGSCAPAPIARARPASSG